MAYVFAVLQMNLLRRFLRLDETPLENPLTTILENTEDTYWSSLGFMTFPIRIRMHVVRSTKLVIYNNMEGS